METKIWNETLTLEKVEEKINEYIAKEILNLQRNGLLEKWNYFPIMTMESEEVITKFLEVITYVDSLELSKDEKIQDTLTLVYLILKEKLDIVNKNTNSIYLLLSYLNKVPLENVTASLTYLNNDALLEKIRLKTLDIEIRERIVEYIDKTKKPLAEVIQWIEQTDYYDLVKIVEQ